MAEGGDLLSLGLGLEDVAVELGGVDRLAFLGAGRRGGLYGGLHGLLVDVGGVALADALGGAVPVTALLAPGILGIAPVVAERVEGLGLGLRLEGLVLEGCGVDGLAGPGAGRRGGLDGGLHGLLLDVAGVALAGALGGAEPLAVLLGPGVLRLSPVMAEGGDFLGLGLGLEALMTKDGGVGPRALLGAGGLVHGSCLYGLLNLPAAIAALGMTGAIPAIGLLLPNIVILVFKVVFALAVGVAVAEHLAVGPHFRAVNGYIGAAGVVTFLLATKAKELRTGGIVTLCLGRAFSDVEDVLVVSHVGVVDVQRLLIQAPERLRVERAVVHVDGNVMAARTVIGVDVNRLAGGVKGTAIERHDRRTVRPDSVIEGRGIERRFVEHCSLVAPIVRLAFDDAAVDNGVVRADETEVVCICSTVRLQCHVLKRNGAGAVKGVVTVILVFVMLRVRDLGANTPRGLVGARANKGKIFVLGVVHGVHTVQGVFALAELDGVVALRRGGCGGKIVVGPTLADNGDTTRRALCKCRRANPPPA